MADPTRWVAAAAPALGWRRGAFERAYARNAGEGAALSLEVSPLAVPIEELAALGEWRGTATDLLRKLAEVAGEEATRDKEWPKNATALAADLKRLAPALRAAGIDWTRLERTGRHRGLALRPVGGTTVTGVTGVTANATVGDGLTSSNQNDRHAGTQTVTASAAANDGDDGRDGSAATVPDRQNRSRQEQLDLIAAAFDVFGEDLDWLPGLA